MVELILNWLPIPLLIANFLVLVLILARVRSFIYEIYGLLSPIDEKTPSPFATFVDNAGHAAGHAMAMELKTTLMGKVSGDARLEQAINSDVAQDALSGANPLLGTLLDQFPSLKKRAFKNPGVVDYLLSKLAQSPGGSNPPAMGDHRGAEFARRLSEYKGM